MDSHSYRTLYFHRIVVARLATRPFGLWLDVEPVIEGEDEIGAAQRLLERLLPRYPRAFDVIVADALYSDSRIYRLAQSHGKDVLTVLKKNTPTLLGDAQALFATLPAIPQTVGRVERSLWDLDGFTSWAEVDRPVRVVCSSEHTQVRRQLDQSAEDLLSLWTWVTTLSPGRAGTATVVDLGHARWSIENEGFNEAVNHWHLDHLYRHQPQAILAYTLLSLLAINLASAFYWRNLHPRRRQRSSALHIARLLTAELLGQDPNRPP